jgi:hypothetical protein
VQAIDEQPSSPFLADGWEVSVDSGGSIEIDISAHGAIASLCLIPPKTVNIAFLSPTPLWDKFESPHETEDLLRAGSGQSATLSPGI